MMELALKLVVAHLIGDFLLQSGKWVEDKSLRKHRSPYLYAHIGVHALALVVLVPLSYWMGMVAIVVSHLLIDITKLHLKGRMNESFLFVLDQILHLLVIGLVVYAYEPFELTLIGWLTPEFLLLLAALLLVTVTSGVIMMQVMSRWTVVEDNPEESLPMAGYYIGMLERLLVFTFIVLNQWGAIGLLIAAKSVLRFSDLSRAKDRRLTEYVLIGTLVSIGLAILVGVLYLIFLEKI